MAPRIAYPPSKPHPHLTQTISPSAAQKYLSAYLTKSETQPYLHPDSQLSRKRIEFSAQAGPNGGLAIHHLRRIAAGLQGENLVKETAEELAKFDSSIAEAEDSLPEGDDSKLDSLISKGNQNGPPGMKKRKRTQEEIEEWAESSSQADAPFPPQELESFANTPLHYTNHLSDWQDQEEYEQQQRMWTGDVGEDERQGAPVVQQGGVPPEVAEVDDDEGYVVKNVKKGKTEAEKRAKKEAKKARRLEIKREKAKAGMG